MSTVITSGKPFILAFALALVLGTSALAVTKTWDFEKTPQGTIPEDLFDLVWSDEQQKGTYVYTTNLRGCGENSKQSLTVHCLPNSGQMGVRIPFLPKGKKRGIATLEFDYMRENYGRFQFELKVEDAVWPMLWVEDDYLHVKRGNFYYGKKNIGKIEPFKWYRIKFMFPLTPQDAPHAQVWIKNLETGEEETEVYDEPLGSGWCTFPKKPELGIPMFWVFHNKTGSDHRFYFDNITLTQP